MSKSHAMKLYDYHVWANNKVFEHLHQLPQDIWDKEIASVFPSISQVVAHIYTIDTVWLGVMREQSFNEIMAVVGPLRGVLKTITLHEMEIMYLSLSDQFKTFLTSHPDLDRQITCEHPQYGRLDTPIVELVQHIGNHGTYHRGNLTAMLRQLGHPGVATDYIFNLYAQHSSE